MKKITLLLLISFFVLGGFAQKRNKSYSMMSSKKYSDVFPDAYQIKYSGWHIGLGITEMKPQTFSFVKSILSDSSNTPASKMGFYVDFGRYKLFEYYSFFRYMDYGIGYKSLRGKERDNDEKFGDHFVTAYFNLNNTVNISKYSYWGNTFGINADYAFLRNITGDAPSAFQAALHYKLSFGYMATKKLLIIPAIETPILNLYPFDKGSSSSKYLSSRYRPIIISVRFLFLRPIKDVCPPVYAPGMLEDYTPTDMGN